MLSAQHAGLVFSPHTFLHTNETTQQQQLHHIKMLVADEDEAAAALCALPSTLASSHSDAKSFQHIWAQVPPQPSPSSPFPFARASRGFAFPCPGVGTSAKRSQFSFLLNFLRFWLPRKFVCDFPLYFLLS
jgi:hypothetical protein